MLRKTYLKYRQEAVELALKQAKRPEDQTQEIAIARAAVAKHMDEFVEEIITRNDTLKRPTSLIQKETLKSKFKQFFSEIEAEVSQNNLSHGGGANAHHSQKYNFQTMVGLWQIGLLIFILSGVINAVFVNLNVGGLPRELARLSILGGVVLLAVGLVKRKKKAN